MFFVFHILLFTILQFYITSSYTAKREINQNGNILTGNEETYHFEGVRQSSASQSSTNIYQFLQNLTQTKGPNLKSNVFDKMLSDELLSIKQYIYDKDGRFSSSDRASSKNNVPTPTLEIKQKWPVMDFLSKFHKNDENYESLHKTSSTSSVTYKSKPDNIEPIEHHTAVPSISTYLEIDKDTLSESELNNEDEAKQKLFAEKIKEGKFLKKVIGLRSLGNHRKCSCESKTSGNCGSQCTSSGSTHKCTRCNHLGNSPMTNPSNIIALTTPCPSKHCGSTDGCGKCTRSSCTQTSPGLSTQVSYSVFPFYMPFQYPIQGPSESPLGYYYSPTDFEEYETTKPRRHSTRQHKVDYYYVDEDKDSDSDYYLENNNIKEVSKPCREMHPTPPSGDKIKEVVLKIDYADPGPQSKVDQPSGGVYDTNKNNFVNELVDDLKLYYPESVVKDCYCKASSNTLVISLYLILSALFVKLCFI